MHTDNIVDSRSGTHSACMNIVLNMVEFCGGESDNAPGVVLRKGIAWKIGLRLPPGYAPRLEIKLIVLNILLHLLWCVVPNQ